MRRPFFRTWLTHCRVSRLINEFENGRIRQIWFEGLQIKRKKKIRKEFLSLKVIGSIETLMKFIFKRLLSISHKGVLINDDKY